MAADKKKVITAEYQVFKDKCRVDAAPAETIKSAGGEDEWNQVNSIIESFENSLDQYGQYYQEVDAACSDPLIKPRRVANEGHRFNHAPPSMPVTKNASAGGHRARKPDNILHMDACVARPVTKDEQKRADPKRRLKHDECKKTEWDRLTIGKVWKYDTIADVREWNDVAEQFRKSGKTLHLG